MAFIDQIFLQKKKKHKTRVQKISRLEIGIWESVNGIHLVIEAPAMDRMPFGESKEGRGAGKLKEHPCLYQRRRKIHSENLVCVCPVVSAQAVLTL